jgi:phosphoribosylformylglycinamidine synthase
MWRVIDGLCVCSEHSRHWFFGGKMVIDGEEQPKTLFRLVKDTIPKDKPSNR